MNGYGDGGIMKCLRCAHFESILCKKEPQFIKYVEDIWDIFGKRLGKIGKTVNDFFWTMTIGRKWILSSERDSRAEFVTRVVIQKIVWKLSSTLTTKINNQLKLIQDYIQY